MTDLESSTRMSPDPAVTAHSAPATKPLPRALEFFLLRRRLAEAAQRRLESSQPGFAQLKLGLRALSDAHQLANSAAGRDSALLLYRAAVRLLLRATLLHHGLLTDAATDAEVWSHARDLAAWSALLTEQQLADAHWLDSALLGDAGEARLAMMSDADRERALSALKRLTMRLAAPLEERASAESRLLWTRRIRIGSVLLVVGMLLAWRLSIAFAPRNLALHQPVTTTDSEPQYGVDPSHVVDGDQLNLGFHTTARPNTDLTIDLGATKSVSRVEVFNRPDCCQERAVPLSVQLSVDGRHFKTVARRTRVFQRWTVALPAKSEARFVRLLHEGHGFFHLSEVEVY